MNAKELAKRIVGDLPGTDAWMDGLEHGCEKALEMFPYSQDDVERAMNSARENPTLTNEQILELIKAK